jgi:hypothetical protein
MEQSSNGKQPSTTTFLLGWILSFIIFVFGFYHTGKGLAEFNAFGGGYGGFIFALAILIAITLCFKSAIKGSIAALIFYLLFALCNSTANYNYFYPHYMGSKLVKAELVEKEKALNSLKEKITIAFSDKATEGLKNDVLSKLGELKAQIIDKGFFIKSQDKLKEIETLLGSQITKLSKGNGQNDWNTLANRYDTLVRSALAAKISHTNYNENESLIQEAEKAVETFAPKLKVGIDNPEPVNERIKLLNDIAKSYNMLCDKASQLAINKSKFSCSSQMQVENEELGRFSHTFSSTKKHIGEANTIIIIIICLLIDFLIPLALYKLLYSTIKKTEDFDPLKRKENKPKRL